MKSIDKETNVLILLKLTKYLEFGGESFSGRQNSKKMEAPLLLLLSSNYQVTENVIKQEIHASWL
jgi:hypothetical protein